MFFFRAPRDRPGRDDRIERDPRSTGWRKMTGELIGKVFTRLTVLRSDGTRGKNSYLKCQCSCGTVKSVRRDALLKCDLKRCGCLGRELNTTAEAVAEARRKPHRIRKKL